MAKQREEEVKAGLPAWMGTYGDMVTLLLCFFVLLFSMSSVDVRKFKEAIASFNNQIDILPGGEALTDGERINNGVSQLANLEIIMDRTLNPQEAEDEPIDISEDTTKAQAEQKLLDEAEAVAEQMQQYMQDEGIEEDVQFYYSLNYIRITLPGNALFDSGEARIKEAAYPAIGAIGEMILEEGYDDYSIQIEGHTDNIPINTAIYPSNWYLSAARAIAVGTWLTGEYDLEEKRVSCTGYGEFNPIVANDTAENRAKNRRVEVKINFQTEEVDITEYKLGEERAAADDALENTTE